MRNYVINSENHTNLKSNVPFEDLPEWFQQAKTRDALIFFEDDFITWKRGIWKGGIWKRGIWKRGIFEHGIWEYGIWENGIWESGIWKNGVWKNGVFYGGVWCGGIFEEGLKAVVTLCFFPVFYSKKNIQIYSCVKTTKQWEEFFAGTETFFQVSRNTPRFEAIYKAFLKAKMLQEFDNQN